MSQTEDANFEFAVKVAQIFSAVTFTLVAMWMTFTNGTSLAYIQRASLEKRLTVCCFINTYVGLFSAFFNFFQLTQVDDILLPSQNNYTIDLARPIEWIATCPLMQLIIVILGGSKIPESRRLLMPSLSVIVLCFGLTSTYTTGVARYVPYCLGLATALIMFSLNAKQIVEHSSGLESILNGDSEFRKASLLIILLWFPFPIWYILSPEGVGLIQDTLLIQVGWAFLNIVSKFSFIFYVQRMKDQYCTKLKAKRELYSPSGRLSSLDGDLTAVVMETLAYLGMAQHSDRILNLFALAGVTSSKQVAALSRAEAKEKMLPNDIVRAVQQRLRVWRLETQDNAEMDLHEGEAHYACRGKLSEMETESTASSAGGDRDRDLPGVLEQDLPLAIMASPGGGQRGDRPRSAHSKASTVRSRRGAESGAGAALGPMQEQLGAVDAKLDELVTKLDGFQNAHLRGAIAEENNLVGRIDAIIDAAAARNDRNIEALGKTLRTDLEALASATRCISEQVDGASQSQDASLADMRRQHMMVMELVSSERDSLSAKISDLNASLNVRIMDSGRLAETVRGEVQRAYGAQGAGNADPFGHY